MIPRKAREAAQNMGLCDRVGAPRSMAVRHTVHSVGSHEGEEPHLSHLDEGILHETHESFEPLRVSEVTENIEMHEEIEGQRDPRQTVDDPGHRTRVPSIAEDDHPF
jgi:hypothetical protein